MRKLLSRIASAISQPTKTVHSIVSTDRDILREFAVTKDDLFLAFQSSWILNRAIRFRADLIVARGFHLEFPDDKSKEIINRFRCEICAFSFLFNIHSTCVCFKPTKPTKFFTSLCSCQFFTEMPTNLTDDHFIYSYHFHLKKNCALPNI